MKNMVRKILNYGRKSNHFYYPTCVIYLFLIFFKGIGLLTLSVRLDLNSEKNISFCSSRLGIVYNIILLISYLTAYACTMLQRISYSYPGKSSLIDNIVVYQMNVSALAVSAVLLSCCFNQKSLAKIGNGLLEVDKKLDMIEFLPRRKAILRRFIAIGIVNITIFSLQCILTYMKLKNSDIWFIIFVRIYWVAETFASVVVSFFVIKYFLLVAFIHAKFVEINRCIKVLSKPAAVIFINNKQRNATTNLTISRIIFGKDMYTRLMEISNCVNDCYSSAILFITIYVFYNLTTNVFYIVVATFSDDQHDYLYLVDIIIRAICFALPISLLSFQVTKLQKEAQGTARIVHRLLNCTHDPELTSELSLFSLQLLHEKPHFTACGFFDLDCSLLQGIIGAVTTYMVILVQFQVSSYQH